MWFEPIFLQVLWQFLKNAASPPAAGEPQITGAFLRRLRRRKMFELISVYGADFSRLLNQAVFW